VALGTSGYLLLTDMTALEAVYMTVTTITTVGFGEIRPLSSSARLFTMGLILAGVATALFQLSRLGQFFMEGQLRDILGRRSMRRAIEGLKDHVIVCGFGRFGRVVAEELERSKVPFVVVDPNDGIRPKLEELGHPFVMGSALDEDVLKHAGVERARAIVLGLPREADNVFIALAVRETKPDIVIHARAETEMGIRRLRGAGARQVVSPEMLGGQRVGHAIVRPTVVDFIELSAPGGGASVDLEEVQVGVGCEMSGVRLRDLPQHGVQVAVVAIKRGDAPPRLSPSADDILMPGDRVVAVGDRDNLRRLATLAAR
jgi:voltage-gated potassium channel